jgi:lipoprotein-anchoring transpeptidase ErfK/SrfK
MVFRMQTWPIARHIILALLIVVLIAVVAVGVLFVGLDLAYADHVFKGVSVEGIPIGGLSRQEALDTLRSELDLQKLGSDINLTFSGHNWPLPMYQIDAYIDLEATVDNALSAQKAIPFYDRWVRRATFTGITRDEGVVVHYDPYKLDQFLSGLEKTINRPAQNAEMKLVGGKLTFQRSQDGWVINLDQARQMVLATLTSPNRAAEVQIQVTKPDVSDEQVGKVITVDKTNHILTLYNNMQVEKQYGCAVGMPSWPTPSGTFKIIGKDPHPTWVNPGSSWAATMPPSIPPGPGNPLGTRALQTSASGVFIHGTYSDWSIGYSVSHGCIRMHIRDSEDIYERVPIGATVLIF